MTIAEIRGMTTGFMAAGGEEPASLMSCTLYYLMQNPTILRRVQDELRQVYPSADDITFADAEKATYFNAVIRETLRIRPPSSGHFSRRTTQETVIDGFVVPANVCADNTEATCDESILTASFRLRSRWQPLQRRIPPRTLPSLTPSRPSVGSMTPRASLPTTRRMLWCPFRLDPARVWARSKLLCPVNPCLEHG